MVMSIIYILKLTHSIQLLVYLPHYPIDLFTKTQKYLMNISAEIAVRPGSAMIDTCKVQKSGGRFHVTLYCSYFCRSSKTWN